MAKITDQFRITDIDDTEFILTVRNKNLNGPGRKRTKKTRPGRAYEEVRVNTDIKVETEHAKTP